MVVDQPKEEFVVLLMQGFLFHWFRAIKIGLSYGFV